VPVNSGSRRRIPHPHRTAGRRGSRWGRSYQAYPDGDFTQVLRPTLRVREGGVSVILEDQSLHDQASTAKEEVLRRETRLRPGSLPEDNRTDSEHEPGSTRGRE